MNDKPLPTLSLIQTRVLGALIEKEKTVPDTYPMTLNGLVGACNQKTSRDPVINASESEVQQALDDLKRLSLVLETSGGRVMRYSHNAKRVLVVPSESLALLTALMLRGPQTAGELRINCDRLCKFSDISAVEGFLNELAQRAAGAYVIELPRQAGARENRWMHLLSGPPTEAQLREAPGQSPWRDPADEVQIGEAAPGQANSLVELRQRVSYLESQMTELRATVADLCAQLGVESKPRVEPTRGD
jgi:uncharacterized protein